MNGGQRMALRRTAMQKNRNREEQIVRIPSGSDPLQSIWLDRSFSMSLNAPGSRSTSRCRRLTQHESTIISVIYQNLNSLETYWRLILRVHSYAFDSLSPTSITGKQVNSSLSTCQYGIYSVPGFPVTVK